jgi:hypothetical protein
LQRKSARSAVDGGLLGFFVLNCQPGDEIGPAGHWRNAMYAVVKIKNQQFRVSPDLKLQVPLFDSEVGDSVNLVILGLCAGLLMLSVLTMLGLQRFVINPLKKFTNFRIPTGNWR